MNKNMKKIAVAALMMGLTGSIAAPAFATTVDTNATDTNPIVNQKDTIKGDMAPHANAPGSVEPKPGMPAMHPRMGMPMHKDMPRDMSNLTQEQRDEIAKRRAMHQEKMKNMTPAEREAAKKKWEAKRAEWQKMTPAQREAAKKDWDAKHGEHKDLNKESRQTNINEGVGSENSMQPAQ